jgi:ligand-binding sensor domain-containing protein/signal transduction histidine kinase/DNA-binding NarL/FixJ family response regulator
LVVANSKIGGLELISYFISKKCLLILFLGSCSIYIGVGQNHLFKHITSNHGLIHNSVFSITQDSEGFMWFGTAKGLSKYDGIKFVNYTYSDEDSTSIPNGEVFQLATDTNGDVWMYIDGEVALFNKMNDSFTTFGKRRKGVHYLPYHINQISKDQNGAIWISTREGIYYFDYENNCFHRYELLPDELKSASIKAIFHDSLGRLWIAQSEKLYRINNQVEFDNIEEIKIDSLFDDKKPFRNIKSIKEDKIGNIYISIFGKGLIIFGKDQTITNYCINTNGETKLSSKEVLSMEIGSQERCWIGTELGISIIGGDDEGVEIIQQDLNYSAGLNDNAIYALYNDMHGNMWIGTYFGGVNVLLANRKEFYHYKAGNEPYFISGKAVSQIIEDENSGLWIATEDKGINYFSPNTKSFTHYTDKGENSISYNNVHSVLKDETNSIWIGTYLGGINYLKDGKFNYYRQKEVDGLRSDNVFAFCEDDERNIWIGTMAGLTVYDPKTNIFSYAEGDLEWAFIYDLMKDSNGNIWIASNNRGIWFKRKGENQIVSINDIIKKSDLKPQKIIGISESSDGLIWFATDGEGVYHYNPSENALNQYTKNDGLPDNTIYAIVEDNNKDIWMSSNNGLVFFNRRDKTFKTYTTSDGLPVNQFNFKSGYKHSDGTLYFGTVNGMISFRTENITVNNTPPEVRITKLLMHNNLITPDSEEKILTQPIYNTNKIELEHDQTEIGFEFVAIDYTAPEQNKFAYKLEGYDENWMDVGNYNKAFYSRIPPGTYIFKVKACNSDGKWDENGVQLQLIVKPPFWNSLPGYLLYLTLLLIVAIIAVRRIKIRRREKEELIQAKLEKIQNEKLNELKLEFYTQVSHELRTPLSLILDPIRNWLDQPSSSSADSLMRLVLKNANRLQLMVNQLLDFRKTEENHFKINIIKGDLSGFTENIFSRFIEQAHEKGIGYTFSSIDFNTDVYYDPKVVDIILYNLLSNAIKYTHKGGKINCQIFWKDSEHKLACIKVSDNGIGMTKENADRIFENFYVVNTNDASNKSMGIGLALVCRLVKLHQGEIHVETEEEKGSTFSVVLPVSANSFTNEDIHIEESIVNTKEESIDDSLNPNSSEADSRKYKLLLVEDHKELQNYLKSFLEKFYFVFTANNGEEALKIIEHENPDVVVSDVMMPLMDGFELCNNIKSNIETSHIPVILLTARTSEEDQTEGLENGADVYLSKPFNSKILKVHISNLLNNKIILKKRFEQELGINVSELTYSNKDEEFIKKAIRIVHDNIADSLFSVAAFVELMGVSKSLLHMKLKEIIGKSASEFILSIRMKEASRLLKSKQYSISEVSDFVGFNDASYFSKSFKKYFNHSPKEHSNE